jgi:carbonic anhydrase
MNNSLIDVAFIAAKVAARVQVERIMGYKHVTEKVEKGELIIKGAYYDVESGKVRMME